MQPWFSSLLKLSTAGNIDTPIFAEVQASRLGTVRDEFKKAGFSVRAAGYLTLVLCPLTATIYDRKWDAFCVRNKR